MGKFIFTYKKYRIPSFIQPNAVMGRRCQRWAKLNKLDLRGQILIALLLRANIICRMEGKNICIYHSNIKEEISMVYTISMMKKN